MLNKKQPYLIETKHNTLLFLCFLIVFFTLITEYGNCQSKTENQKKWKILHIMSYHSPWKWTDDQLQGFKEALIGLDVQYNVFQMDTKRQSSEQWKQQVAAQAKDLIDIWKPDLVYTNDDNAQMHVAKHYVNSEIPFVFSDF